MKPMIKKIRTYKVLIIFFLYVVLMHMWMHFYAFGDDTWFAEQFQLNMLDYLLWRYNTWSSRLAIEAVAVYMSSHLVAWIIADILIWTTIPMIIGRIYDLSQNQYWSIIIMLLLYPMKDMSSAGWIVTSCFYIWPLWCLLITILITKTSLLRKTSKWYEYITLIVCIIFGCCQEQVAALTLGFFLVCMIYQFSAKHNFKLPLIYLGLALNTGILLFIQTCPGNAVRTTSEIDEWLPAFENFSFIQKIALGLYNISYQFILRPNHIFLLFIFFLCVLIYGKTNNLFQTIVSSIPATISLTFVLSNVKNYITLETVEFTSEITVPILYLFISIACILMSLWWLLGDDYILFGENAIIIGAGFLSAVILSFSPTVFSSLNRVFIFFYFCIYFVCISCYKKYKEIVEKYSFIFIIIGIAVAIANILFIANAVRPQILY